MTIVPDRALADPDEAQARARKLVADGRTLEAIEALTVVNRALHDPDLERRLVELRYEAFADLERRGGFAQWPVPADLSDTGPARIPEITARELEPEVVRRNIMGHGSVLIRNLLDEAQIRGFVTGIDHAFAARSEGPDAAARQTSSWFGTLRLPAKEAQTLGRHWVGASGGMLLLDSPKMLFNLLETYESVGLRAVVGGYLGERPVLGGNKCTLRLVPLHASTDWHQDGAFLGPGIRALNVWIALSECGVDSPGMDLLPRRLDHIVETGTGGSIFDWAVGPEVVDELAAEAPVMRPVFHPGDALLFDDMFLHRTAIDPTMTRPRYAIESWFFAPSHYPDGQVPIVW